MADVHDTRTRSYNMSRIRSANTRPEMLIRKYLFSKGFRYRLHVKNLPGKPDIVLPKYQLAIFVHGCFWHGHEGCKYFVIPKTRTEWWVEKIRANKRKDDDSFEQLVDQGWKVMTIWECELKPTVREESLSKLFFNIQNSIP